MNLEHPHDSRGVIPERLAPEVLRECSVLRPGLAIEAVVLEWVGIFAAIVLCELYWHPALYLLAVLWLGARQHALSVIGHDAAHYRFLPGHARNDLFGNVLLMWPVFVSVEGFRKFHGPHHQYTNVEGDGNRILWRTHDAHGQLVPEWRFPKTKAGLALFLLKRAFFLTGLWWVLRGLLSSLIVREPAKVIALRYTFYAALAALLSGFGAWSLFLLYWVIPFCTWHVFIQYARLTCEHSNVQSQEVPYQATRTTIPTLLESLFILPRNIGYHLAHHWYPSVPFYNLPLLHQHLMAREGFREHAVITRSLVDSLRQCVH